MRSNEGLRPVTPEVNLKCWSAATAVAFGTLVAGGYGWSQQIDSSQSKKCATLTSQAGDLAGQLYNRGTIGLEGSLIQIIDIRNPLDPDLTVWGTLKNQRDAACLENRQQDERSFLNLLARAATLLGGIVTVLGIQKTRRFWRMLKATGN